MKQDRSSLVWPLRRRIAAVLAVLALLGIHFGQPGLHAAAPESDSARPGPAVSAGAGSEACLTAGETAKLHLAREAMAAAAKRGTLYVVSSAPHPALTLPPENLEAMKLSILRSMAPAILPPDAVSGIGDVVVAKGGPRP